MRCVATTELRARIEELLSEGVGFQRITTLEQAEVLVAAAVGLLDYGHGVADRERAVRRVQEMAETLRVPPAAAAARGPDVLPR